MVNNHKYNLLWDKKYLKLSNIEEVSELKLLKTRLNLSNAR